MATLNAVAIVANIIVPGAGLVIQNLPQIASFLAGINGKCDQLSQNEAHFKRVSDRLHELLTQLTAMEAKGQLPSVQVVKRYTDLLDSFDAFLTKYLGSNFLARLLTQETVLTKITVFHQEVDELLTVLNLAHIAQMTDWRAQYDADQKDEAVKWAALLHSNRLLVEECTDSRKQREAMLRLLHALHHNNTATAASQHQRRLIKQAFQTLQRLSHAPIEAVPPWFVAPEDVSINHAAFARGATASVFHGVWRSFTPVVVKCFDASVSCEREVDLWFSLRHPHVVGLYGACHVGATRFALCEVAHTSLDQYLAENDVNQAELVRLLWEASLGVQYIQGQGIVHGDLKCNNLVVTHDGHVKVTDFGCSFHLHKGDRPRDDSSDHHAGGLRWTAPECLDAAGSSRTLATDIYALGMCFIEAVTRTIPFPDCTSDPMVREAIRRNMLPDTSQDGGPELHALIVSMCAGDPTDRPLIRAIVESLHAILVLAPQAAVCAHCTSSLLSTAVFCHNCGSVVKPPLDHTADAAAALESPISPGSPPIIPAQSPADPMRSGDVVVRREYGYALESEAGDDPPAHTTTTTQAKRQPRHSIHLSTSDVQSMVLSQDIEGLVDLLAHGRAPMQERTLQALLNMTSEAPMLVAGGVIVPLVALVTRGVTPTCKELAAALLGLLAFRQLPIATAIRDQGGVAALIKLLRQGTFVQRSFALRGLAYITDIDAASCSMVMAENGLSAIYDMLRGGSDRLKEHALWILANLSDELDGFSIDVTVLQPVVGDVEGMSYDQQAHALRLLANSMEVLPRKLTEFLIPLLVTMLRRHQHEHHLVRALAKAADISDAFALQVVDAGAVPLLWTLYQQHRLPNACLVALNNVAINDDCRCQLSRNRGLHLVLGTLTSPSTDPALHTAALHLCFNLALEATNREWIVELGGVAALLHVILARDDLVLLGLETLARLTLISSSVDSFVPVVAWVVQQLVRRSRDGTAFVDLALTLLQNTLTSRGRCEEAFLSAGGVAILLKLLSKAPSHHVVAVLANVATQAESVSMMTHEPETMHALATCVGSSATTHLDKLHALRCIANVTFFEPGAMVGVKSRGVPLLLDILAKPKDRCTDLQTLSLAVVHHLAHHPPFQTSLTDDAGVVRMLKQYSSQRDRASADVAQVTLRMLGVSPAIHPATSIYAIAVAKLKRVVFASNQEEHDESLATVLSRLQNPKTRRAALDVLYRQIPHTFKPDDVVLVDGAVDAILAALASASTRHLALQVVALIVDHSCSDIDQRAIGMLLPALMYIAKHGKCATERSMATEAAMTLGCHGDRKSAVMDELVPETTGLLDS
ncbi:serine/threonine protein kinase [Aphanomyces invadans]|uniref:Serine/threonine protein kinase n=1 Tax=Aphanomyces invadans TaxID=157072 RepID=A0A024TZ52_9STRA|nr:serine/threonine protein kinase [Aphanomyces invadans]ETV99415.1 serine/threonine protein kinase [Aphanomyces invadans]|eukprot:XP_008871971.1 serine/threonine protein kinase [Aphanomyces invadans]